MNKTKAVIRGVHGYTPSYILTNKELEGMVDTNDEWIRTRTGIVERRIMKDSGKATVFMGTEAALGLIRKAEIDPLDIDLVICATVTADYVFPDNGTAIAKNIGAVNAYGYDINAACSGFLYSLTTASMLIESGRYKNILVVGTDKMSSITDYTDRSTCILFGDGAGAVLLSADTDSDFGFEDAVMHSDASGRNLLFMKAGGALNPATTETVKNREHFAYQDGRSVFKQAVLKMAEAVAEVMQRNQLKPEDIHWVVPHQANLRILTSVSKQLDLPMDKFMVNIQKYGNTTSATIPLCLWEWESKLKKGDRLLITAFGGGFTWGAIYLKWAYDTP